MSDSKKLPIIEIGDTVVFRTDLKEWEYYGGIIFKEDMMSFLGNSCIVREYDKIGCLKVGGSFRWFSNEMVAKVIKPSKARVYSGEQIREAIKFGIDCGIRGLHINHSEVTKFFESLNTEGK